jgi:hypothetical protein
MTKKETPEHLYFASGRTWCGSVNPPKNTTKMMSGALHCTDCRNARAHQRMNMWGY